MSERLFPCNDVIGVVRLTKNKKQLLMLSPQKDVFILESDPTSAQWRIVPRVLSEKQS
jgi:hypothetical protein